jgi:hypothetical protein
MNDPYYEIARQNLSIAQLKAIIKEKEGKQVKRKKQSSRMSKAEMKRKILIIWNK